MKNAMDPTFGGSKNGPPFALLDSIELTGIRVECIVGVYPRERNQSQPLEVDLRLYLDTRKAAAAGSLHYSVDYARLTGELRFLLESSRFLMLETAADAICRYILAPPTPDSPHAEVLGAEVKLTKPSALRGGIQPSLRVVRLADEVELGIEEKDFGRVDVLHESHDCGIYRLRIAPGQSIPTHLHKVMDESELVLSEGLRVQGRKIRAGTCLRWPHGFAHRYDNPTRGEHTILCVNRPTFISEDEIEVATPPGGLVLPKQYNYYPRSRRRRR